MSAGRKWSRSELLIAFRLYCQTPFGKLHHRNSEIIELASLLNRTPSSVAMKACNFANLDPYLRERGISGLKNISQGDRDLWDEFEKDSVSIATEAENEYLRLKLTTRKSKDIEQEIPEGPTEVERLVKTRRVQGFFRTAVLLSYENKCAISGLNIPVLLNASHIIPWKDNSARRADPRNGIALNVLYDRAFDRGLISFDESMRVVLSPKIAKLNNCVLHKQAFLEVEGRKIALPVRFAPDRLAVSYHRENIFQKTK